MDLGPRLGFHDHMPYGILSMPAVQTRVFEALGQQRILFKYQTIFESSGIFAGFWMSSQGYDYNASIAVAFSFFACVPIFVTLYCAKAIGLPKGKVYLLGALMLMLSLVMLTL